MRISKTKKNEKIVEEQKQPQVQEPEVAEVVDIPEAEVQEVSEQPAEEKEEKKEKQPIEKDDSEIAIPATDITENKLAELKKKYKKLYQTFYIDKVYVWHRLDRKTFNTVCENTKNIEDEDTLVSERERRFCEDCIVYPHADELKNDLNDDVIPTKLAQEILYKSGFFRPVTQEI